MKNLRYFFASLFILAFVTTACQDDDAIFGEVVAPSNIVITAEIVGIDVNNPNGDGSGFVNLTAVANNAITYNFSFGDGLTAVSPSGEETHRFSLVGLNTYTVVVNAVGSGGVSSSASIDIDVFSSFDDQEAKDLLSGGAGNSKTWYWSASDVGHLGVGPANSGVDAEGWWWPKWYEAAPFEKAGDPDTSCIYEDEFTFSQDVSNQLTYALKNNGQSFYNGAHSGLGGDDICLDLDTSGTSIVSLAPSSVDWSTVPDPDFYARGTVMNFSGDNFMGYFVGMSSYDIIELTNTTLKVRVYDALNPALAWYHIFSTTPPDQSGFESDFNNLVWSDEFDTDGAPDAANWNYDLGAGGWGNQEVQTYTNDASNVVVQDGSLIIKAINDGGNYTSARLKSENLFEFNYGRVEVRAKLPGSQGTWPAIWMLGANFDTVGWPTCGEIDIMEQTGWDKNTVMGTCHWLDSGSSSNASYGETTTSSTATSEFHNYTLEWKAETVQILIDDTLYYTLDNSSSLPFNADFFLILNVAMGGTLGGDIDPAFTTDTMEIDYVRVYQ